MKTVLRYQSGEKFYKLTVHRSGKYRYASTQPTVTDEKTGKKRSLHVHWGTLDDQLRFYPNEKYLSASEEERNHLVFPDNWDLSLLEKLDPDNTTPYQMKVEKRSNTMTGFNQGYPREILGAEQIYRLIHALRETGLSSDDILNAVLSMENRD